MSDSESRSVSSLILRNGFFCSVTAASVPTDTDKLEVFFFVSWANYRHSRHNRRAHHRLLFPSPRSTLSGCWVLSSAGSRERLTSRGYPFHIRQVVRWWPFIGILVSSFLSTGNLSFLTFHWHTCPPANDLRFDGQSLTSKYSSCPRVSKPRTGRSARRHCSSVTVILVPVFLRGPPRDWANPDLP